MSQHEQITDQSPLRSKPKNNTLATTQKIQKSVGVARPTTDDFDAWDAYWKAQNQSWRGEPEVNKERQKELKKLRTIVPDHRQGIYPFKGIKLDRADIEWLLATHEDGKGPIDWSDEKQRKREGLDLRGADLSEIYLSELPLACLQGGLKGAAPGKIPVMAAVFMKKTNLREAHLEGADLTQAHLEGANLDGAHLEGANLDGAHLEGADLDGAHLEGASLWGAHLEEASLWGAHLEEADLTRAHLERADFREAYLERAKLRDAIFSDERHIGPLIADVQWGTTNLAIVDWSQVAVLGDEYVARQEKAHETIHGRYVLDGYNVFRQEKVYMPILDQKKERLNEYQAAARANRQLAIALQAQGLNEVAARFAYRAQRLQRILLRLEHKIGQYLFSCFLDLLAGYGYRPVRSILWYLAVIIGFAIAYHVFGHLSLYPPDAFVYSLTSFHGRGFFPGFGNKTSLHDPLIMMAAIEAVIGLFIEISFIATFTQRFFGK